MTIGSQRQIVSCIVLSVIAFLTREIVLAANILNLAEVGADPKCAAEGCNNVGFQPDCLLVS